MTDVRLTATNPEDSSVVPVACNAKGELKLEEPLAFDGNLNGDLTVTGSASFAGNVTTKAAFLNELQAGYSPTGSAYKVFSGSSTFAEILNNGSASFASNVETGAGYANGGGCNLFINGAGTDDERGAFIARGRSTMSGTAKQGSAFIVSDTNSSPVSINYDGSATFSGRLDVAPDGIATDTNYVSLYKTGAVGVRNNSGFDSDYLWTGISGTTETSRINKDGSATFAGGKAGFTAEGNLWCTTVRGDTVILDATSGGMGSWQDYTPPQTRREIIEQKVQSIKDAAIKPSQQLPDMPEE